MGYGHYITPTPYVESNAVIYAMNGEIDKLHDMLEDMYPSERRTLAHAMEVVLQEIEAMEDGD